MRCLLHVCFKQIERNNNQESANEGISVNRKFLLPALDKESTTEMDGCWQDVSDAYDFLLKHLKPEYESVNSAFDGGTSAIPHMFEQVMLFEDAFFHKDNPNHQRALAEWEAVFVIMALKRIKNIDLDLLKVDLIDETENPFLAAAYRMKPRTKPVLENTTWDFLYILLLGKEPIALFTPRTLVCPAKEFKKKISCLSEWLQITTVNGEESLQLKLGNKGTERIDIAGWLNKLNENIQVAQIQEADTTTKFDIVEASLKSMIDKYSGGAEHIPDPKVRKNIFPAISNNIRDEYSYLNFCCDFEIKDPKIEFLADKLPEDIFCEKLLLIQYEEAVIISQKKENGKKLKELVNQIMQIGQKMLIEVRGDGREMLPLFALVPLNESFVNELIEHDLGLEDILEEYDISFHKSKSTFELVMTIKNFPYSFTKIYAKDKYSFLYAKELPSLSVWPPKIMHSCNWNTYYLYISEGKETAEANVAACAKKEYEYSPDGQDQKPQFKIVVTNQFPRYIQLVKAGVKGYIPVRRDNCLGQSGNGTLVIYADIGYTTSSLAIQNPENKDNGVAPPMQLNRPESLWILKNPEIQNCENCHFMPQGNGTDQNALADERYYFKNVLNRRKNYKVIPEVYGLEPLIDGYVPFYDSYIHNLEEKDNLSLINMQYKKLEEDERKGIHIFLEQVFLYAVEEAAEAGGEYFQLRFLHSEKGENNEFGELKNLMTDAFQKVLARAGAKNKGGTFVECIPESKALAYSVLKSVKVRNIEDLKGAFKEEIHIGVDIGCGKTVTALWVPSGEAYKYRYAEISFGGRNISFLDPGISFKQYKNILSVFLSEPYEMNLDTENKKLPEKFSCYYDSNNTEGEYYENLFDIIAMKIEKGGFCVSPDIFNKKDEFRIFLKMMTYNFYLLFFQIGILIGTCYKEKLKDKKKVTLHLSGNGAKFLRWILNYKKFKTEIRKDNYAEMFIVPVKKTILDVMAEAAQLCTQENNDSIQYSIKMEGNPKTKLLEGYMFLEHEVKTEFPDLSADDMDNFEVPISKQELMEKIAQIHINIFGEELGNQPNYSTDKMNFTDVNAAVSNNSFKVCQKYTEEIENMSPQKNSTI